jgi:Domain of unknown function (DUF6378)
MIMSDEAMLIERAKTHGDFTDHARITTELKAIIRDELSLRFDRTQPPLSPVQREALDMICHKIGRIIAGNPNINDHWDDIAGYAKITSQRIKQI